MNMNVKGKQHGTMDREEKKIDQVNRRKTEARKRKMATSKNKTEKRKQNKKI